MIPIIVCVIAIIVSIISLIISIKKERPVFQAVIKDDLTPLESVKMSVKGHYIEEEKHYHSDRTIIIFEKLKDEYYIKLGLQGWQHGGHDKHGTVTKSLLLAVIKEDQLQDYLDSFRKCADYIEVSE